jgi:bis(5'-nucleosyl)-tetraphosphatase (symmetrical)
MATYVVGDIHGCFETVRALLDEVRYRPRRDRLWLVGDLVNRGPFSLEVLRWARGLGDRAVVVLGNHETSWPGCGSGLSCTAKAGG